MRCSIDWDMADTCHNCRGQVIPMSPGEFLFPGGMGTQTLPVGAPGAAGVHLGQSERLSRPGRNGHRAR